MLDLIGYVAIGFAAWIVLYWTWRLSKALWTLASEAWSHALAVLLLLAFFALLGFGVWQAGKLLLA